VAALTTHQAARLLGVSLPTVVKWIKEGRLEAYKTPGGHRRIPEAELKQFCETFGMPFPGTVASVQSPPKVVTRPRLILSSYEKDFADLIQDFMRIRVDASVEIVSSALQCGMLINYDSTGHYEVFIYRYILDELTFLEHLSSPPVICGLLLHKLLFSV